MEVLLRRQMLYSEDNTLTSSFLKRVSECKRFLWDGQGAGYLEENEERLCVICLVNERDTTVLPCRSVSSMSRFVLSWP